MKRYLKLLGLFGVACFGLSGVGIAIGNIVATKDGNSLFVAASTFAAGVLLISFFIQGMRKVWDEWMSETNEASYLQALRAKTGQFAKNLLFTASAVEGDLNDQEKLITQFREDYRHFFFEQGSSIRENTPLQNTATQTFWNILALQKHRLDKAGLSMSVEAQRMCYLNGSDSVTGNIMFDGKYEVSEVFEMIRGERSFYRGKKKIAGFKSKDAARYHMLNVRKTGKNSVICPNCGSTTTRENLIDGCDFCHTKFLVEDLGLRISDFGMFSSYEIEYKKYKETRARFILRTGLIALPFMLSLAMYQTLPQVFASPTFGDHGMLFEMGAFMFFATFRALFLTSLITGAVVLLFSPVLQTRASMIRYKRADIKKMQQAEEQNELMQDQIREEDPMFSLGEFFSGIQNKLAVFHYAENAKQMEAFTENREIIAKLPELQKRYRNVVNFDVKQMVLEKEETAGQFRRATVSADLVLLEQKGSKIRRRTEKVCLKLIRNTACKTNSVCAPAVMTCEKCGAPHHVLDGRTCQYCGNERRLSDYDWAIEMYL